MSADNQFEVPDAFPVPAVSGAPALTHDQIRARYELCEDLATHLQEFCETRRGGLGLSRDDCLLRCHAGLADAASGVNAAEARWIALRLAERLGWHCPPLPDAAPAT